MRYRLVTLNRCSGLHVGKVLPAQMSLFLLILRACSVLQSFLCGCTTLRMATILLVEDYPDLREELAELLREIGYVVVAAGDGEEALRCLRVIHPNVVLLDLVMPRLNGWEVIEQ